MGRRQHQKDEVEQKAGRRVSQRKSQVTLPPTPIEKFRAPGFQSGRKTRATMTKKRSYPRKAFSRVTKEDERKGSGQSKRNKESQKPEKPADKFEELISLGSSIASKYPARYTSIGTDIENSFTELAKLNQEITILKKCVKQAVSSAIKNVILKRFESTTLTENPQKRKKRKQFVCSICSTQLGTSLGLTIHLKKHTADSDDFECSSCSQIFDTYKLMTTHYIEIHSLEFSTFDKDNEDKTEEPDEATQRCQNEFDFLFSRKCSACLQTFDNPTIASYSQHVITQHGENKDLLKQFTYICAVCDIPYIVLKSLATHWRSRCHEIWKNEKKSRGIVCEECGMEFSNNKSLISHSKLFHADQNNFICEQCGNSFTTEDSLSRHVAIVHQGEYNFPCGKCDKKFKSSNALSSHERIVHLGHKPYACKFCSKCFGKITAFREHLNVHTGDKPFKCKFCNKGFAHQTSQISHEGIHQGFKCKICGEILKNKFVLQAHRKQKHSGDVQDGDIDKTITQTSYCYNGRQDCDICGKVFKNYTLMYSHKRLNHMGSRYVCEICGKAYKMSSHLNQHKQTHDKRMKFSCSLCERQFRSRASFYSHKNKFHVNENAQLIKLISTEESSTDSAAALDTSNSNVVKRFQKHTSQLNSNTEEKIVSETSLGLHTVGPKITASFTMANKKAYSALAKLKKLSSEQHNVFVEDSEDNSFVADLHINDIVKLKTEIQVLDNVEEDDAHLDFNEEYRTRQLNIPTENSTVPIPYDSTSGRLIVKLTKILEYKCIPCGKTIFAKNKTEILQHTRTHTANRISQEKKKMDSNLIPREQIVFDCIYCEEKTYSPLKMMEHCSEKHSGQEALVKCNMCSTTFQHYRTFYSHRKTFHRRNDTSSKQKLTKIDFTCNYCEKKTVSPLKMIEHSSKEHPGLEPLKCNVCPLMFRSTYSFYAHSKSVHKGSNVSKKVKMVYECSYCEKKFDSPYKMVSHCSKEHPGELDPIKCNICGKKYRNADSFYRHKKLNHADSSKIVTTEVKTGFDCNYCQEKIESPSQMMTHCANQHSGLEPVVKCSMCPMTFHKVSSFYSHKKFIHPPIGDFSNVVRTKVRIDFDCNYCEKKTMTPFKMIAHCWEKHPELEAVIKCNVCQKLVRTVSSYYNHRTLYHSDRAKISDSAAAETNSPLEIPGSCPSTVPNVTSQTETGNIENIGLQNKDPSQKSDKPQHEFIDDSEENASLASVEVNDAVKLKSGGCPTLSEIDTELQTEPEILENVAAAEDTKKSDHENIHLESEEIDFVFHDFDGNDDFDDAELEPEDLEYVKDNDNSTASNQLDLNRNGTTSNDYVGGEIQVKNELEIQTEKMNVVLPSRNNSPPRLIVKLTRLLERKCIPCDKAIFGISEQAILQHCKIHLTRSTSPAKIKSNSGIVNKGRKILLDCNYCDKKDLSSVKMMAHCAKKHPAVDPLKCNICSKTFRHMNTCYSHKVLFHYPHKDATLPQLYLCESCGKEYLTRFDLERHFASEHGENAFSKLFQARLGENKIGKHSIRRRKNNTPKKKTQLNSRSSRTIKNGFDCHYCEKKNLSPWKMVAHCSEEHPGLIPLKCKLCPKTFTRVSSYYAHKQLTHDGIGKSNKICFDCNYCEKKAPSAHQMSLHCAKEHPGHTPLKCNMCPETFSHVKAYYNHRMLVHDKNNDYNHAIVNPEEKTGYDCHYCQTKTESPVKMIEHCSEAHPGLEPLKCPLCPMMFRNINTFYGHKRSPHFRIGDSDVISVRVKKYFDCHYCEMKLESPVKLKVHCTNEHPGEKLLIKCSLCPKIFRTAAAFYLHKRLVHDSNNISSKVSAKGKIAYDCIYCEEKTMSPSKMMNHCSEKHPELEAIVKCKLCSKKLPNALSVYAHKRKVHNSPIDPNAHDENSTVNIAENFSTPSNCE